MAQPKNRPRIKQQEEVLPSLRFRLGCEQGDFSDEQWIDAYEYQLLQWIKGTRMNEQYSLWEVKPWFEE